MLDMLGRPRKFLSGKPTDDDREKLADDLTNKALIGRLFNHVEISPLMIDQLREFYKDYFDPKIPRPDFSSFVEDFNPDKLESPFDEKGNFKPWVKKYIPKEKEKSFNDFINLLIEQASQEIYDEDIGGFYPEFYDDLGTVPREPGSTKPPYLLQNLIDIYGKEVVLNDLVQGVLLCFVGELSKVPQTDLMPENAMTFGAFKDERDLISHILTRQNKVRANLRTQLDNLKKANQDKGNKQGFEKLSEISANLIQQGQAKLNHLEKYPCRDPGNIVRLMTFANAVYALPVTPADPLFLHCVNLLDNPKSKKNNIKMQQMLDVFAALKIYQDALEKFPDPNSNIYKEKEELLKKQYAILSELAANNDYNGIQQLTAFIKESTGIVNKLSNLYKQLQTPSNDPVAAKYIDAGEKVYQYGYALIYGVLNEYNNKSDFPATLSSALGYAGEVVQYREGPNADNPRERLQGYIYELPPTDAKDLNLESNYSKYIGALVNLGHAGPNAEPRTLDALLKEKRKLEIQNLKTQMEKLNELKEQFPSSSKEYINSYIVKLINVARASTQGTDRNRSSQIVFLDANIKALEALKHYQEALNKIENHMSPLYQNREMLLNIKEKELFKLIKEGGDLTGFANVLEQDSELIKNFNALYAEMKKLSIEEDSLKADVLSKKEQQSALDVLNSGEPLDPNQVEALKKGNLLSMKNASNELFDENERMALELLQKKHNQDDLILIHNCLVAHKGVIEHRGKEEAKSYIKDLNDLTKVAPGQPSLGKKIVGLISVVVGLAIIGLGIAGIPFTLGSSAGIGFMAGGALLAAGGAVLAHGARHKGLSKKLNKLEESSAVRQKLFIQPQSRLVSADQKNRKLSDESKQLMEEVVKSLKENKGLNEETVLKLYKATQKDSKKPENQRLRNFIIQHIVPHLSRETLQQFTHAIMKAHLNDPDANFLLRESDTLSAMLYIEYAKKIGYQLQPVQPAEMVELDSLVRESMEKKNQPDPSTAAKYAIYFTLAELTQPTAGLDEQKESDSLDDISLDSQIELAAVQPTQAMLAVVQGKIFSLQEAIPSIQENPEFINAAKELWHKVGDDYVQLKQNFSNDEKKDELQKERKIQQDALTRMVQVINEEKIEGRLIGFNALVDPERGFDKKYGSILQKFLIHAVIKEFNDSNNPFKEKYGEESLINVCGEVKKLAEKWKDHPEKLADLSCMLVKMVQTNISDPDNTAGAEFTRLKDKYNSDSDFAALNSALESLNPSQAVRASIS